MRPAPPAGNQQVSYNGGTAVALTWDAEGRLASSTPAGGSATTYVYGADGQRAGKIVGGAETNYVRDLDGSLLVTYINGSFNNGNQELWVGGKHFGTVSVASGSATTQTQNFSLTNWLGTEMARTDPSSGIPTAGYISQPFGDAQTTLFGSDSDPLHFTGKERDAESGNDYFGARYYGSSMGRFTSPDWSAQAEPVPYAKLDNPQSLNLYSYVLNNPLTGVDVDGHAILGPGPGSCAANAAGNGCSTGDNDQNQQFSPSMAQQQSGTSSTEAQNEQHQYDLVVERTNKLLGGAKDSDGDVINAADHISSACGLVGGNCEFKIKNGDADSDFRSALNKSLGEADGDTGAHGGLSAPTHRVGFSTSLHHDNDALHVDHYNGAKFPLGTLLHAIVDVGVGHLPYYGSNHAFSYAGVQ